MKLRLKGLATIDDKEIPIFGKIEVISKKEKVVYAVWSIFDNKGNNIAGLARNYFIGDNEYSDELITNMILENILKYRMGRKNIFKSITID